jgi:hypothetical protein
VDGIPLELIKPARLFVEIKGYSAYFIRNAYLNIFIIIGVFLSAFLFKTIIVRKFVSKEVQD